MFEYYDEDFCYDDIDDFDDIDELETMKANLQATLLSNEEQSVILIENFNLIQKKITELENRE